jgi:DNA segregation ATPase FtsK/SpoIIIE-like protein
VLVSDKELEKVMNWWKEHNNSVNQMLPMVMEERKPAQTAEPKEEVRLARKPAEWVEEIQPVYQEELQGEPQYVPEPVEEEEAPWETTVRESEEGTGDEVLIRQATKLVRRERRASASYLQRQLRIGYPKAAWLVDQLEARGVLGLAQGGGKEREILPETQDPSTEAA